MLSFTAPTLQLPIVMRTVVTIIITAIRMKLYIKYKSLPIISIIYDILFFSIYLLTRLLLPLLPLLPLHTLSMSLSFFLCYVGHYHLYYDIYLIPFSLYFIP